MAHPQSCSHRLAEVWMEYTSVLADKSAQCTAAVAASCLEGQIGLAASSRSQHIVYESMKCKFLINISGPQHEYLLNVI